MTALCFLLFVTLFCSINSLAEATAPLNPAADGSRRAAVGRRSSLWTTTTKNNHPRRSLQTDQCQTESANIQSYVGLTQALYDLDDWRATQTSERICEEQNSKVACVLNYTLAPENLEDACAQVGAVYVTSTSIFQCDASDNTNVFYSAVEKPLCYGSSCGADDVSTLADIDATNDMNEYMASQGVQCTRVRLEVSDPIIPTTETTTGQNNNCTGQTTSIMADLTGDPEATSALSQVPNNMKATCVESQDTDNVFETADTYQKCNADFGLAPFPFEEKCGELNGVYMQMEYTLACQQSGQVPMLVSVLADPFCVSKSCTLDQLQNESALDQAMRPFLMDSTDWDCTVLALRIEDFAPSPPPTISPAPTSSFPPTGSPTQTPAPTVAATGGDCLSRSILLNQTSAIQEQLQNYDVQRETWALEMHPDIDGSFQYQCKPELSRNASQADIATSDANIRRRQRRQLEPTLDSSSWCEVVEFAEKSTDEEANGTSVMRQICEENGGMFVEEIFTVHCESMAEGDDTVYERSFYNKPACRAASCNAEDLKQVLGDDMEWLRAAMEQEYENDVQCVYRKVNLLAGVGNVDGYQPDGTLPSSFQVTEECASTSNTLSTNIAMYNERERVRQKFKEYSSVDLRQICTSSTDTLTCDFDWLTFLQTESDVPYNNLCQQSGGQFVTSTVLTTCTKADEARGLQMYSRNYPSCLGLSCSPGQSQVYLQGGDGSWMADEYTKQGWACTSVIQSVFAPDYLLPGERPPATAAPTRAPVPESTTAPTTAETEVEDSNTTLTTQPPQAETSAPEPAKSGAIHVVSGETFVATVAAAAAVVVSIAL